MESNNPTRKSVYRILDANSNRAAEGLRTLEEYFRFIVEDGSFSLELKQLRHELMVIVAKFDRHEMLANRDVNGDIGRSIKTDSEQVRASLQAIIAAASQRVQQSLRCLEEYGKYIDPSIAASIEKIRYRAYELLAVVELRATRNIGWLSHASLYVLIDCQLPLNEFLARASDLSQAGVDMLQIRDKRIEASVILEYARQLTDRIDVARTRIIVNDRVDLASTVGNGVHLGQEDLPIAAARRILPDSRCIGISTHTIEQALEAQRVNADYIGCGPTFPSQTKSFGTFSGLDFLRQVADGITIPAFAIGGIGLERLDEVLSTGIRRVAVSYAIWQAADPAEVASRYATKLRALSRTEP